MKCKDSYICFMENVYRYYPHSCDSNLCEPKGVSFEFSSDFLNEIKKREEVYEIFGIKFISHSGHTYYEIKERFEKGVFYFFISPLIKSDAREFSGMFKTCNN